MGSEPYIKLLNAKIQVNFQPTLSLIENFGKNKQKVKTKKAFDNSG